MGDVAPLRVSTVATPYAASLARRVLVAQVVLFLVALAVSSATDEGGVAFSERLARTLPLAPFTSALAALLVVVQVRRRGEERALAALGLAPAQVALWCSLVACATPSAAALAIATGAVGIGGFYPSPPTAPAFVDDGVGFASEELGVAVDGDGELHPLDTPAGHPGSHSLPRGARAVAALGSLVGGLALALSATRGRGGRVLWALSPAALVAVVSLLAYQLAAAGRIPTALATAPMLGLLALEVVAYRRAQ